MAHTKAKGTSKLGRDSASQRLGVKKYAGELVRAGGIIVRQRGTNYISGANTKIGKDDTIYAVRDGRVKYTKSNHKLFTGRVVDRKIVSVV